MSTRSRWLIVAALVAALMLGTALCLASHPEILRFPVPADQAMQSFWLDDFGNWYVSGRWQDAAHTDKGFVLSRLHSLISVDDRVSTLARGQGWAKAVAPDGRLYSVEFKDKVQHFYVQNLAKQTRDLGVISETQALIAAPDGRIYGLGRNVLPIFIYDTSTDTITHMPEISKLPRDQLYLINGFAASPRLGTDGLVYGVLDYFVTMPNRSYDRRSAVFALDLTSGTLVSQTLAVEYITALTPRPGGGMYLSTQTKGYYGEPTDLWVFDPGGKGLISLPMPPQARMLYTYILTTRRDGRLYGYGFRYLNVGATDRVLYVYTPSSGDFETLASLGPEQVDELFTGPDDHVYVVISDKIMTLETDRYMAQGIVQSDLIKPVTLASARTVVGSSTSAVRALTCGRDGQIYGVTSGVFSYYQADREWLFWYNSGASSKVERAAPNVVSDNSSGFLGGTTLVALNDGRLVGGTTNGRLFVYNPTTGKTSDMGKPFTQTWQIAALAVGHDGLVYGGTSSYYRKAALFTLDPSTGVMTETGSMLPQASLVGALTVAPDGKIYTGFDGTLVVYDPITQHSEVATTVADNQQRCLIQSLAAGPDGRIYGGCGMRFFVYDPAVGVLTTVGEPVKGNWIGENRIAALVVGNDGRVYGSVAHKYANSEIFAYDPATEQLTNLGIALPLEVTALTTCNDGTIYGGTGVKNSYYRGPAYVFSFRTNCAAGPIGTWDSVTWEADTPRGTRVTVDVLDRNGKVMLNNVRNGGSLRAIAPVSNTAILLQATLSTTNPRVTPVLKRWRVDYTFQCRK